MVQERKGSGTKCFRHRASQGFNSIAAKIKEMTEGVSKQSDVWQIHDFITEQRELTDSKYDYRRSAVKPLNSFMASSRGF